MKNRIMKKITIAVAIVLSMIVVSIGLLRIHLINDSNNFKTDDFHESIDDIFGIIRCKKICDKYEIDAEIDEVFDLKDKYEKFLKQVDLDGCDTRNLAKVIYINNYLEVDNEEKYIRILKEECYNDYIGIFDTWAFKKYEEENIKIVKEIDINKVADTIYIYGMFYGTELEDEILADLEIYEALINIYNETEDIEIKSRIYGGLFNFEVYKDIDYSLIRNDYVNAYKTFEKELINNEYIYSMAYYLSRNDWKKYDQLGIDCTAFKDAAKTWTFEAVNKSEWEYDGNTEDESMLLLSGLYMDEVGIEDSIFLIDEFAKAYGQTVTDYSNNYLVEKFDALCEEFLDKQILFGI